MHAILTAVSDRLRALDPTLTGEVGRTHNDVFPLRGYVVFRRRVDGDEVVITIDVRNDGRQLVIESDVVTDDGRIIGNGPYGSIPVQECQQKIAVAIDNWFAEFEAFLKQNEAAIETALSQI